MKYNQESNNIEDLVLQNKITPNLDDEDDLHLTCDSTDHTENPRIREGNKVCSVLIKEDEEWELKSTVCWKCSVRDIVDKYSMKDNVAVIGSTLKRDVNNNRLVFSEPKLWELLNSSAT